MKKIIILIFTLSSLSYAKFDYQISIKPNGIFNIDIQMKVINSNHLAKTFYELFLNENNHKTISDQFRSLSYPEDLPHNLYREGSYEYNYETQVKKSGVLASIKNKCEVEVTSTQIQSECTVISSHAGLVGKLFDWGSSNIKCIDEENIINCNINILGKAKDKNFFPIYRTADRLAISGSIKTINDIYKSYNLFSSGTTNKTNDNFYHQNISNVWKRLIEKLNEQQRLTNKISISSSPRGVLIQ